jgi:hypothetical protein
MLRYLRKGSRGADVRALQEGLNQRNQQEFAAGLQPDRTTALRIGVDGDFGRETDGAVRDFQQRHDLDPDGIVGPLTRRSLFSLGVASITVVGLRLQPPRTSRLQDRLARSLFPGRLHLGDEADPDPATPTPNLLRIPPGLLAGLAGYTYSPVSIPGLDLPIAAPQLPDGPLTLFGPTLGPWKFDHREVAPGVQTTFPFGAARQDAFTLTMQMIYTRGDPEGKHLELTPGVQFSAPLTGMLGDGSVWSFNPFVQITDVDRFGNIGGWFHWWQPYAQIGGQVSTGPDMNPTITGTLFPINLGIDATDFLTVTAGAGLAFGFNPLTGQGAVGPQLTFGANFKFGAPDKKE